jgi:hypothetical protein
MLLRCGSSNERERSMKTATYKGRGGKEFTVEYDPAAPCIFCGQPVLFASMGGTAICSWCDCGKYRDGSDWAVDDALNTERRKARARAIEISLKT